MIVYKWQEHPFQRSRSWNGRHFDRQDLQRSSAVNPCKGACERGEMRVQGSSWGVYGLCDEGSSWGLKVLCDEVFADADLRTLAKALMDEVITASQMDAIDLGIPEVSRESKERGGGGAGRVGGGGGGERQGQAGRQRQIGRAHD